VSKLTLALSVLILATLPLALGCSSGTCVAIPDGVYTAIGPDGQPLLTSAFVLPLALDADLTDGALLDAARDAGSRDAAQNDAAARDAATRDAAARDASAHDAAGVWDAGRDVASARDAAAHDAGIVRDGGGSAHDAGTTADAATAHDAADPVDAEAIPDAGGTNVPVTYTFHGGLPVPYDTWDCRKSALTCEMTYICNTPGQPTVSIVTSYVTGPQASLAFSVTPPGTVVHLQPPPPLTVGTAAATRAQRP
jgi:hypothetical protein